MVLVQAGLLPTGHVITQARDHGFDNVHDYLVNRNTGGLLYLSSQALFVEQALSFTARYTQWADVPPLPNIRRKEHCYQHHSAGEISVWVNGSVHFLNLLPHVDVSFLTCCAC